MTTIPVRLNCQLHFGGLHGTPRRPSCITWPDVVEHQPFPSFRLTVDVAGGEPFKVPCPHPDDPLTQPFDEIARPGLQRCRVPVALLPGERPSDIPRELVHGDR